MGILDALRLFLRDPVVETSLSTVQGSLRQAVSVEQMCQLASLGPVLYEVVVKTRMRAAEKLASADESKSIDECIGGPGRYSAEEQELWYVAKTRIHESSFLFTAPGISFLLCFTFAFEGENTRICL